MNLLHEIIAAAAKGQTIPFKFSHPDGSLNGHPHSVSVQDASLWFANGQMLATARLTVAAGFEPAGPHTLSGVMTVPHGPSRVSLDEENVPDGKMVLLGHLKGKTARAEIVFYCPTAEDPLRHFRVDGTLGRL